MNYQERVQAIAEKMASGPLEGLTKLWKDVYLNDARIAVAEMAYVYTLANLPHYHMNETMLASGMGRINREMKELGLISDDAQDHEAPKESAFEKAIRETVERNNGQEAGSDGL